MRLLSEESVSRSGSGFVDGVEFEETFPELRVVEPLPVADSTFATSAAGVTDEELDATPARSLPEPSDPEPKVWERSEPTTAPRLTVVANRAPQEMSEASLEEQLDRRLYEAEAMVKQTTERMRIEEEQRLTEWVAERRAEEERRLATWAEERRAAVERSMEQRRTETDELTERMRSVLVEWQGRFEDRLEQRHIDEERFTERRRQGDEEKLSAWRTELELSLIERFSQRQALYRAPLRDRGGEVGASLRDALASATSARDVCRLMRDVLSELTSTCSFALALHHADSDEVAYRYRVASDDDLGMLLRRDSLDDAPGSAPALLDDWARTHRTIRVGEGSATVHTAQLALRVAETTVGVLTLQSDGEAIADTVLSRVTDLAAIAAPRLAELRDRGSFNGV